VIRCIEESGRGGRQGRTVVDVGDDPAHQRDSGGFVMHAQMRCIVLAGDIARAGYKIP
jgi:hypothetical protein